MRAEKDNSNRRRLSLRTSDKVLLGVLGVLIVLILALAIVQRFGLLPIKGALVLYLSLMAVAVLLVWGINALVRRIGSRLVKTLVGVVLGLVLVTAVVLAYTYISYMSFYVAPQKYSTIVSPSGAHRLVVMRAFDTDEGRVEERKAARLANAPDGSQEASLEDWGFIYRAYPEVLGLFYRSDADVDGEVYLSISDFMDAMQAARTDAAADDASTGADAPADDAAEAAPQLPHGKLMVEWLNDGNTAHFFVENPGVAEGGDCYVNF